MSPRKTTPPPVVTDPFAVHRDAATTAVRRTPAKRTTPKRKPAPVVVVKASKEAMDAAHELAKGRDVHVAVQRDGSVLVANGSITPDTTKLPVRVKNAR